MHEDCQSDRGDGETDNTEQEDADDSSEPDRTQNPDDRPGTAGSARRNPDANHGDTISASAWCSSRDSEQGVNDWQGVVRGADLEPAVPRRSTVITKSKNRQQSCSAAVRRINSSSGVDRSNDARTPPSIDSRRSTWSRTTRQSSTRPGMDSEASVQAIGL